MKTIFVVDDSDTNLAMAEEALEDYFNVMTVPSAAKMFALLEKITPDLILLDVEMPEMNGFEALERLKDAGGALANVPVIFLTGTINPTIEQKCLKYGAVSVINKPFTQSVLIEQINSQF